MRGQLDSLVVAWTMQRLGVESVRGGWEGSACGGRGHQRGNAVANEC